MVVAEEEEMVIVSWLIEGVATLFPLFLGTEEVEGLACILEEPITSS